MARRPDFGEKERIWSREDLKGIMRNLSMLNDHGVRKFYQRAYQELSSTLIVQAWRQLRKWRRP